MASPPRTWVPVFDKRAQRSPLRVDTIAKDWGYIVDGDHKTVCADLDLTTLEDF